MRRPTDELYIDIATARYHRLIYIEEALRFKDDGTNTNEIAFLLSWVYDAKKAMDGAMSNAKTARDLIGTYGGSVDGELIERKLHRYNIRPERIRPARYWTI